MFYENFKALCDGKGIPPNRVAAEIGLSNSLGSKWKKTGATPHVDTIRKVARYFDIDETALLNGNLTCRVEDVGKAESAVAHLRMLLHYHERMMMGNISGCKNQIEGRCAREVFADAYADTLREAIRCVKLVNRLPEDY